MKLELQGARDLEKALHELKSATAKGVARRVLKKAAQPVADRAAQLAPEQVGDLAESYVVTSKLNKNQPRYGGAGSDEVFMHVGSNDRAAVQQEFGNRHHGAQPHLRPAWEENQEQALDMVTEGMRVEVSKSVARARRKAARG